MTLPTDELLERLAVWQRLGLVTDDQVRAIAAHERGGGAPGERASGRQERTTAAEAIGYVGAALVLGAIGLFVGEFWDGLTNGGQLALATLITVVLAGAAASLRSATSPALSRLTSVLLVGVVAGVAWSTVILTAGVWSWEADDVGLAVGLATVAVTAPLYVVRRRALSQLALLTAVLTLLSAVVVRGDLDLDGFWFALPYAALGAVWLLLGEGGYLAPRRLAAVVGGALTLVALQVASFGGDLRILALVLGLGAAGALVVAAVTLGGLHHLGVGAIGLFVLVPQLVFELFGDAIGAPATLLLVGIVLVLLAVGLGRARREVAPTAGAA